MSFHLVPHLVAMVTKLLTCEGKVKNLFIISYLFCFLYILFFRNVVTGCLQALYIIIFFVIVIVM